MTDTALPRHPLRVREVVAETHDSRSIVFERPTGDAAAAFAYRPGQFLTLRLSVGGRVVPRCYSLSSTPGLEEGLRITVKRVTGGVGSNWVCDHVRAGDTLEVLPPAGVFVPSRLDRPLLLMAGGSGVTPVFSILRAALAAGGSPIALFFANRDERSVIFAESLRKLAAQHPHRLEITHWLDSVQGVPSPAQLQAWVRRHQQPGAEAFVCGPGPFMDAAVAALDAAGLSDEAVHVERYVSLPEEGGDSEGVNPASASGTAPSATAESSGVTLMAAEVEIQIDGENRRIACGEGETILDAAKRQGLELPHACRAGLCASCRCKVVEGTVHLRHNEALDERDLSRHWTLACQALPTAERVTVRFSS